MKIIRKFSGLGIFLIAFLLVSCHVEKPDYQVQAERFIQVYYLNIDPQGALAITQGPAKEKMLREVALLRGVARPEAHETPKMNDKILSCQPFDAELAHCDYEIHINGGQKIVRRGRVTLRKSQSQWWATQFVEELGAH